MGYFKGFGLELLWGKSDKITDKQPENEQARLDRKLNQYAEDTDQAIVNKALKEIAAAVLPVSTAGRQTTPDTKTMLQVIGELRLSSPSFNIEFLEALESLAMFHPDISAAVDNISLANTEIVTEFDESVPDNLAKEMLQVLSESRDKWYLYADGINGFIDDSLTQCAISGAISHEWIVNKKMTMIANVAMVSPKNIYFHLNNDGLYEPVQKIPSSALYWGPSVLGTYKKLNTLTYRYAAMRRIGENPIAVPPFLSSLENLAIQKNMVKNLGKIIEKIGLLGFLKVMYNAPQRKQGEDDTSYYNRLKNLLDMNIGQVKNGFANGFAQGFKNEQEIEMVATNQNVAGAESLMEMNDRLVINGMKQPLEMMNRKNTTSETFGRVQLAKLSKQLTKYQTLVANSLSYGDWLHLALMGYPVTKVINTFEPVMLGDRKTEEEAYGKKIENADKLYNNGVIGQLQRANILGYKKPDQEEPRVTAPVKDNPEDKGKDPTQPSKKTDATKNKSLKLLNSVTDQLLTIPETGMGYHVVACKTNLGWLNAVVTNCEYASVPEGVELIYEVRQLSQPEVNDFFVQSLSRNKPTFWGYAKSGHYHGPIRRSDYMHGEELGVPKKEIKFWNNYNKDVSKAWEETTDAIRESIVENLQQVTYGVTQQAMEGNVLYSVYSKVNYVFVPLIKPIVQKHVEEIYTYYRKSQSPWKDVASEKKNIPDAVFNLTDIRAIEWHKDSDNFYLGKFVTDPDTQKRMVQFIKSKYLEVNAEIGDNKKNIAKFAEQFQSELLDEGWKMRRIIDTTVNSMRNNAGIMYMDQAEVTEFKSVGISDRLQCDYCRSMNGKVLSIKREVVRIERIVSSDPSELPNIKPFLTSLKIPASQIAEMSGDAIQDMGVGAPGYHPLCRCSTVVNII